MNPIGLGPRLVYDILTVGLMEFLWQAEIKSNIRLKPKKALICSMTGVINPQGNIYKEYAEKYILNMTSEPLTIHLSTTNGKAFDYEIIAQNGQFLAMENQITGMTLNNPRYGKESITGDALKNNKYFIVLNGNPYQIAVFSNQGITSIELFNAIQTKLEKYVKATSKETARAMTIKYFINNGAEPIDIEMEVTDGKDQKVTIPAQNVDILTTPAKITSVVLNDGESTVTLDQQTIKKYAGFYVTSLKEKNGILYIEPVDFKFPITIIKNLWWQGALACD